MMKKEFGVLVCTDPKHLSADQPTFFIDIDEDALVSRARAEIHNDGVAEELGLVEGGFAILTKTGRTLTARQEGKKKIKDIVVVRDDGTLVLMLHVRPAAEDPGAVVVGSVVLAVADGTYIPIAFGTRAVQYTGEGVACLSSPPPRSVPPRSTPCRPAPHTRAHTHTH